MREWTDVDGVREESGHRIFDVGNDLACTFSEGGTPEAAKIYEAPMHGAADDRGDYFSAPEEMEGDSTVGQKCTVRRTRSPING